MPATIRTEESIFAEALEKPLPDEREAFVESACGNDAGLRARVRNLLKSHSGAGSFLHDPLGATLNQPLTEGPGTIIGPYKLLQQIGEGGMGVVYMAEQETPVRRRVALKIIKPGMDSRAVIARFEAERQALAMMDHQNIARVLDAGTTGDVEGPGSRVQGKGTLDSRPSTLGPSPGRPYFVMELVHGVPITKYCDDNRLTLRQRLELFVPVCQAIQHAHQKGVIHRDIKPGNILVTMYDDKPVPKVIDFGVAKAVEQRLTEKTLFTQFGTLVGTFEYMSPEQAEMNALGVDTRSDVYSLGVLLYELLTGTTPLDKQRLRETALHELIRMIKEEEPPRPSVRLSSSGELPKVAAACRVEPGQLPQMVRGELDWIVMKCLEKDRSRRYETANGLARDVQRYLSDEPVEACPPSMGYRFRKAARKHRGLLATAASFVALLVVGVIVTSLLAAWAMRSEHTAQEALRVTQQALDREQIAHQEAEAARQREKGFSDRLRRATQIANDGVSDYYRGNWALAHEHFAEAAEIQPELRSIYENRAMLYTTLGLWDRAAADYDRRLGLGTRSSSQILYEHALLKFYQGDDAGYRELCHEILQQYGRAGGNDLYRLIRACALSPEPAANSADLVRLAENLIASYYGPWNLCAAGLAHLRADQFELAADRLRDGIERGTNSPEGVHRIAYAPLAIALHRLGKAAEAQDALRQAEQALDGWTNEMADGSPGTMPIDWHAWMECSILCREAKTAVTGSPPPPDPRLQAVHDRALAVVLYGDQFTFIQSARAHVEQQEWDQAAAQFGKVLDQLPPGFRASSQAMRMCVEMVQQPEVFDRLVAQRPRDTRLWYARGRIFASGRDWERAAADYTEAISRLDEKAPPIARASRRLELAAIRLQAGDEAACRELCAAVVAEQAAFNEEFTAQMASRTCTLMPDAVDDASIAVRLAQRAVDADPSVAWYQWALGAALYRAGEDERAVETLETSLDVHPAWVGRGQNYIVLAMACQRLGRHEEARDWLAQAKSWMDEINQRKDGNEYGFAASDYLSDWLTALLLLPEAGRVVEESSSP